MASSIIHDTNPSGNTLFAESAKDLLLIEDNPADARMVEILLQETDLINCKIVHKLLLKEALELLETGIHFDAVLCDLSLPDSRGFETLEKLLTRRPNLNVIVLTGYSDKYLGLKAIQAGAQDFLVKGAYDGEMLGKALRYSIERRSALDRLEETQRLARIGNWELSLSHNNITASEEFFRITGLKQEKRTLQIDEFKSPEHPLFFLHHIHDETLASGNINKELSLLNTKGEICHLSIKCRKEPNSEILYGIIQDITESKNAEELRHQHEVAQQASRMKEQFLASVSHEMRTPMNAILGMSNLVLETELDSEQKNYLKSIKQSSEILLGIVNDILEVSTLKNGSIEFDKKPFNLHDLLANLINVMSYKAMEKSIEFDLSIEQNVPLLIKGDKLRLNQILYNLVGNAIKFTDSGKVSLYVRNIGKKEQGAMLEFMVEDTGIGIPKDQLEAVFESFTRVRHKDRLFEGTGLGLSIARSFVLQQEGRIWAESEIGRGSRFYFSLPFEQSCSEDFESQNHPSEPVVHFDNSVPFSLLLVEDHKLNQLVARKTLEKQFPNIAIKVAENGKEAIDILQTEKFSLVLMDLQMPVMDGEETALYIRNEMPHLKDLPILAMTAHAHISKGEQYKKFGMNDFLLKPFEPQQLYDKIIKYAKI